MEAVKGELNSRGIDDAAIAKLQPILELSGSTAEKLEKLSTLLSDSETGLKGIEEMRTVFEYIEATQISLNVELDLSLARGLNYYTGAIFEVKANDFAIGSICGGGRYDNLTGIFGMPDVSGVGISFGADRIYDVMVGLNLFPAELACPTKVLLLNLGKDEALCALRVANTLRKDGFACEVYPDSTKMKKQMEYANRRGIPYVAIIGSNELAEGSITLKNMQNGEQMTIPQSELAANIK